MPTWRSNQPQAEKRPLVSQPQSSSASSSASPAAPKSKRCSWTGKSWQMCGELPHSGNERPYNRRKMILKPPSYQQPMRVLNSAGIACYLIKGDKYGDWSQGQDNISISLIRGGWEVFCVADGHGSAGHWVSAHATRVLPDFLSQELCQSKLAAGDPKGALQEAFRLTQADLVAESKKENLHDKLSHSGATFACILKDPEHNSAWVAHLGDSRTVMFSPDAILSQTQDHNAKVPAEKKRVEGSGCEVREKTYTDGFSSSRIYITGTDSPGIMMTRCFGDLCVKAHGVIAEPEITHWQGTNGAYANECYIISASDGIWEFLDTQTVHAMVSNHLLEGKSLQDVCELLVTEAKSRWAASEPEYCDDISVIILPLTGKALPHVEPARFGCLSGCSSCSIS